MTLGPTFPASANRPALGARSARPRADGCRSTPLDAIDAADARATVDRDGDSKGERERDVFARDRAVAHARARSVATWGTMNDGRSNGRFIVLGDAFRAVGARIRAQRRVSRCGD